VIRPIQAWVVRQAWAERVVAPMHDALPGPERAAVRARNPDSFLHVTRRPDDPDADGGPASSAAAGRAALERLLERGAYVQLDRPALVVYRLADGDHTQDGLVAWVPVEAFASGRVRGHEDVQPERVAALRAHLEAIPVRSDPVALIHRPSAEVAAWVARATADPPMVALGGQVRQAVWVLDDPAAIDAVGDALADETLYVADGHHRVAASIACWEAAGRPPGAGVLSILFPADRLRILPFHRLLLGPLDPASLTERLAPWARTVPAVAPEPARGTLAVYVDGRWWHATLLDAARPGVEGLDVTRLHRDVLDPLVAAEPALRVEFVPGLGPPAALAERVGAERGAAFALAPPSVDQLLEVADRGEIVPPKSTYFDPKPRSGLILAFATVAETATKDFPRQPDVAG
jgi:uncharacterized protein (DUF1015 family)